MSNPAPTPTPRPDLRLVSPTPPVAWEPVRPVLVPATPPDCAVGPDCPGCTETWPQVEWETLEDADDR